MNIDIKKKAVEEVETLERELGVRLTSVKALIESIHNNGGHCNGGKVAPIENRVTDLIHEIGIPASIKGYKYVRVAIVEAYNDPDMLESITKELYPAVAEQFEATPSRVERAIRHGIEVAWERCDIDTLQRYFGNTVSLRKGKPTNSEFISLMVEKLRQEDRA